MKLVIFSLIISCQIRAAVPFFLMSTTKSNEMKSRTKTMNKRTEELSSIFGWIVDLSCHSELLYKNVLNCEEMGSGRGLLPSERRAMSLGPLWQLGLAGLIRWLLKYVCRNCCCDRDGKAVPDSTRSCLSVQEELLGTLHKMSLFSTSFGLLYFLCFVHKTKLVPSVIFFGQCFETLKKHNTLLK